MSIGDQLVSDESTFETVLIIGQVLPFQIDDGQSTHDVKFITYFESVNNLEFEKDGNKVLAEMNFEWSPEFVEPIPFVHAEIYLPVTWDVFLNHEINTFVNGFQVFGLVDKSQEEEIIIHFLINNKQLKKLLAKDDW